MGLVGLHVRVADLHPDAIILVHTHDSYIQNDMSHRCDLLVAVDVCVSYGTRSPPWAAHVCVICSRQLLGNNTLSYRTMSPIRSPLLSPVALGLGPGEGGCTGAMVV